MFHRQTGTIAAIGLGVWQWDRPISLVSGAMRSDALTLAITGICCAAANRLRLTDHLD